MSGNDPTFTVNKVDTIIFDIVASRHPFNVKTEFFRGGGDQVTRGILSGTQGTQNGILSWDTKGLQANTIMFVLQIHPLVWTDQLLLNK